MLHFLLILFLRLKSKDFWILQWAALAWRSECLSLVSQKQSSRQGFSMRGLLKGFFAEKWNREGEMSEDVVSEKV